MAITADSMAKLMDQLAGSLELYAAQWTRSPTDAVQEAFISLACEEDEPQNPRAWLYKVVRFRAINAARAESRRQRHEAMVARESDHWFESTTTAVEEEETVAALKQLTIEQREVIVARLWGDLSFREIAELMNSSHATCHRRYQEGLDALRKALEPPCPQSLTAQTK